MAIFNFALLDSALLGDQLTFPPVPLIEPVTPVYSTDIAEIWNPLLGGADFEIVNSELASNQDLLTSITLSLFCDRLALPSDALPVPFSTDRRGWWGDTYNPAGLIGSRLWLLSRAKSTPALLQTAQGYCVEALSWLTTYRVVSNFTVNCSFVDNEPSLLAISITVYRQGQPPASVVYNWVWQQITNPQ